jgi:hypothetical protein
MQPTASMSQDATIAQLMLHGALHGLAGLKRIKVYPVAAATARKHFCGKAFAIPSVRGHKRTPKEKTEARRATKRMVEERAKQLGYLPRDYQVGASDDRDEADAACVYDWAVAYVARETELWRNRDATEERDGGREAVDRRRRQYILPVG